MTEHNKDKKKHRHVLKYVVLESYVKGIRCFKVYDTSRYTILLTFPEVQRVSQFLFKVFI